MRTYVAKKEEVEQDWFVVDAADRVLGRFATKIATILMGKHKPTYTAHVDTGDFVVVVNAEKIRLTGAKADQKTYERYSGYPGGLKSIPFRKVQAAKPGFIITEAVRRMLPKSKLGRHMLSKLKVYAGPDHPHAAQKPQPLEL